MNAASLTRTIVVVATVAGCASHTRPEPSAPLPNPLTGGVVFDHPDGLFTEVILSGELLDCGSVHYTALDATGWIDGYLPWLSLTLHPSGDPSYMLHTDETNEGPGLGTVALPGAAMAVGDVLDVAWEADTITLGDIGGTSQVTYCGVLSVE